MPHTTKSRKPSSTSEAVTNNVRVEVVSCYAPDHSQPFQNHWFFHYTITITNEGDDTVQLLSRHWVITDASGHTEEVVGPGVVGEQPVLGPGESFTYTSSGRAQSWSRTYSGSTPNQSASISYDSGGNVSNVSTTGAGLSGFMVALCSP